MISVSSLLIVGGFATEALGGPASPGASHATASASASAFFGQVQAGQSCSDQACNQNVRPATLEVSRGQVLPEVFAGPVSVTMTAHADSSEPNCSTPDRTTWDVQWWVAPGDIGAPRGAPRGPGWIMKADFGILSSGASSTAVLSGVLQDRTHTSVIIWTGQANVQCGEFSYVGRASCPVPAVAAHAVRHGNPGDVTVSLNVARLHGPSTCHLSARVAGQTVSLRRFGSTARATRQLSSPNAVCTDSELVKVRYGDAGVDKHVNVPGDHLAVASAHAVRAADGTVTAVAQMKGLFPAAHCGKPVASVLLGGVATDMTVSRTSGPNARSGTARATRVLPPGSTCNAAVSYNIRQDRSTARATRAITGAPCTLAPAP